MRPSKLESIVAFIVTAAVCALPLAAQQAPPSAGSSGSERSPQGKVEVPGLQQLTISGAYRLRFEGAFNYDLQDQQADDRDFFTQRVRLNFDAEVTDRLSAFVQIQDVRNWGEESSVTGGIGTTDPSADGLDLHRAFVRLEDTVIGGTAKVGRQVLAFGDQRLVGGLEWLSQGRAFDGYRHTWKAEDSYTFDFFATAIKERMPSGVYDDALFAGGYATIDSMDDTEMDVYLLLLQDEETAAGGNEHRLTLGLRLEHQLGALELGAEVATQIGEVNGADIDAGDAYAAHVHGTWNFAGASKPWVRLEGNYATGNDPTTAGNERFKNLFPTAHGHWGMMDFALWENMLHGMVEVGFKPDEDTKLAASWHVFESVEETDSFVGPVGKIAPTGAAAGSSNSMGSEIDLFYNREFDTSPARTWVQIGYGIFLPGSGAKAVVGDDDTAHFFYLMTGVTF